MGEQLGTYEDDADGLATCDMVVALLRAGCENLFANFCHGLKTL
jgi:hypothetical protein